MMRPAVPILPPAGATTRGEREHSGYADAGTGNSFRRLPFDQEALPFRSAD